MFISEGKSSIIFQSPPMVLELGDNKAVNGETFNLMSGMSCYKIIPKDSFQSMGWKFRTLKVEFGSHLTGKNLPPKVIFFLTSEVNSYGVEQLYFADGDPYVVEGTLNHETVLIMRPRKWQYMKEMREGCSEQSPWEMAVEGYLKKSAEMCPVSCTAFAMPGVEFQQCTDQSSYLCSAYTFTDEFNRISESYSTSCNKLEYTAQELSYNLIRGFPRLVLDESELSPLIDISGIDPNYPWNWKPTVILTYRFDIPEKTWVYRESLMVDFIDLVGIVGGTLSLYIGLTFFDAIFQIADYCKIIIDKINNKGKSRKVGIQKEQPRSNQSTDPEKSNEGPEPRNKPTNPVNNDQEKPKEGAEPLNENDVPSSINPVDNAENGLEDPKHSSDRKNIQNEQPTKHYPEEPNIQLSSSNPVGNQDVKENSLNGSKNSIVPGEDIPEQSQSVEPHLSTGEFPSNVEDQNTSKSEEQNIITENV